MERRTFDMSDEVLVVEGLSAGYHKNQNILTDVSFAVRQGEMVGLIGPNGAGKSTLLKTLRGLLEPLSGSVEIGGRETSKLSSREFARQVAYLQQNIEISFGYSAREIVMTGRYPHLHWLEKESDADALIVDACMAYTGVDDLTERPVHMMSGGQRQRVLLAKVLAQQTPLLFLDEPATGLDIFYQEEIFRFCRELCDRGNTVLMVVHELSLASRFCSRLMLVGEGRIISDGPPSAVMTSENLSRCYGVPVRVVQNPTTGSLEVFTEPPPDNGRHALLLDTILGRGEA